MAPSRRSRRACRLTAGNLPARYPGPCRCSRPDCETVRHVRRKPVPRGPRPPRRVLRRRPAVRAGGAGPQLPWRSTTTGSSTASCRGCTSTSGCSSSPRTRGCPCSSGPASWRSSPATSTSSSWSAWPASSAGSRPASPCARRRACCPARCSTRSGPTPSELMQRHAAVFREDIVPALRDEGIELVRWDDLDREEQKLCKRLFKDRVFPVLTPAGRRPGAPLPLHLRALAQPRRAGAQPAHRQGALRAGQGAADRSAGSWRWATSGSCRWRTSSASTCAGSSPAWRCSRCTPSG